MSSVRPAARNAFPPTQKPKPDYRVGGTLLVIVFILILHKFLGALSYNFFVAADNVLNISSSISPILMWAIMGMLIGALIGSAVVSRKYKLPVKLILMPAGALVVILLILCSISGPLTNNIVQIPHKDQNGTGFAEISTSRSIADYQGFHYGAGNLTDADDSTAWMYVESENNPASVNYVFNTDSMKMVNNVKLVALMIYTGYAKTYEKWKVSNKPQSYRVYKNGVQIGKGNFVGNYGYETVQIEPVDLRFGDTVRINILSSYKPVNKKVNIVSVSGMYPVINFSETQ